MEISALFLCLVLMVVGVQFLRGKWLGLLNWLKYFTGQTAERRQMVRVGVVLSPGLIGLGLAMFCWGFFGPGAWRVAGNSIFTLALVYELVALVWAYISLSRSK